MPIEPLQPEQKLSSEQKVQELSVSPDIGNTHVSGLPLSTDALKMECLKIANSFAASINAVEENYLRLLNLVHLVK